MTKAKKTASEKTILNASVRKSFGKQVKKIRKEGFVPGNIFGTNFKSQAISVNVRDFIKTYKSAKETGIVYVKLDKEEVPVLIRNVQRHPVNDSFLHVDFRKVDLTTEIETEVPVKIIGASEAVTQKGGVLLTLANALHVKALPEKIPAAIEIDITKIKEIGQEIKVGDLTKSATHTIIDPADKVIVSVVEHKEESVVAETAAPTPEVITEKVPAEGEETAAAEPGAKKAETAPIAEKPAEKKAEKKPEKPEKK